MERRVEEIKNRILHIASQYMDQVSSEEEMRYLLLEKDLDNNDALNLIYDFQLIELLHNPYAQDIVENIWTSPFNNSESIASASSIHNLLLNWNDCRQDKESQMRFYRNKDLNTIGCHGFQFQVWRYAGQSRYLVTAITNVIFVCFVQWQMIHHLKLRTIMLDNQFTIDTLIKITENADYWKNYFDATTYANFMV